MHKIFIISFLWAGILSSCVAQPLKKAVSLTRQDTLRGSVTPERAWWDVVHYDITVEPDHRSKTIAGKIIITSMVTGRGKLMQLDLQQPMHIDAVLYGRDSLPYWRDKNVYYVRFPRELKSKTLLTVQVMFSGKPREAVNPPWDGGWIWATDGKGKPWMSVACQGLGSSVWYPCKDHQGDEPDSARLTVIVPAGLIGVGNGRLTDSVSLPDNRKSYTWTVVNPINNYNIIPYIGRYTHWSDVYEGEKGKLDLDYWVLEENLQKATMQFQQVKPMLKCFEHWFGPYPFYEDGYKLVESPHLGMEHQSAVAYGNRFGNGYLGRDLSGTGWGKKWDFIIVHESGHEWFGNNITTADIADMWVHEGFTNYSETIYTECQFGKEAGQQYSIGSWKNTTNETPLIGKYGVNQEGSGDMYSKGGGLVHMIRQIIDDDDKFRMILRGLNTDFYHQTVSSAQVEKYIIDKSGKDLSAIFNQYLRTSTIPLLEYRFTGNRLRFRWSESVEGFNMPLRIRAGTDKWIYPSTTWQEIDLEASSFSVDPNFYVRSRKI